MRKEIKYNVLFAFELIITIFDAKAQESDFSGYVRNFTGLLATKLTDKNFIWYPQLINQEILLIFNDAGDVDVNMENSEIFFKYSMLSLAIDFEIMAGYLWDDGFTAHKFPQRNLETNIITGIYVYPGYHRMGVVGGSFTTTPGGKVLQSEGVYYMGKHFSTETFHNDGLVEKNYLHYLGGLAFSIAGITMSTPFSQKYKLDYSSDIVNNEFENTMLFLVNDRVFMKLK
ncbi:MAG TPA: hypothetical protein VK982_08880 [Bacteroidales bacterium]|nr:hypothetical protein [Bacteroidales bacterium]